MQILEADNRRNGISGVGFYVGIVKDDKNGDRKLVISFEDDSECYTAVLDVDEAANGNVYMFPEGEHRGGNAWRGDHYAPLREDMKRIVSERHDRRYGVTTADAEDSEG